VAGDASCELSLEGSDPGWVAAYAWARRQAQAYRYDGDPVGPWYEAALPGRSAFCVRDVCHQSTGAQILGMSAHTKNMLRRFAASVSDGKDWCPFWEITRDGTPAAVDYKSDQRFWYNLPGSFDLVDACYRQFLWTGDADYLDDPVFQQYYRRTMEDFIERWDRDGDGLPEHRPEYGSRGIATYNEQIRHPQAGGDLLGAMYAAFAAHATLQARGGDAAGSRRSRRRAVALRRLYNAKWWNEASRTFHGHRRQDGSFSTDYGYEGNFLPLYFGLPAGRPRVQSALDAMLAHPAPNIEGLTYVVDILLEYGRVQEAWALLRTAARPEYPRSEYPEVSFCTVGALVRGLAGLSPDASRGLLQTVSRLPDQRAWLRVGPVPVLGGRVTVTHVGRSASHLVNEGERPLRWRAAFPGLHPCWKVNGRLQPAGRGRRHGEWYVFLDTVVAPGQACAVERCP